MEASSIFLGTIVMTANTISLVMPPAVNNIAPTKISKELKSENEGEVTHGRFFGENITRVIKTLKK